MKPRSQQVAHPTQVLTICFRQPESKKFLTVSKMEIVRQITLWQNIHFQAA
ncbi:MAG: hypothetical protein IKZ88_08365 [Neisseriaceae bacterium]|nr:hypothetical protein [Neisseriaceae bacterium]